MTADQGISRATEEEQGRKVKATLSKSQTLVVRNEVAFRFSDFRGFRTSSGGKYEFSLVKIFTPPEYTVTSVRDGSVISIPKITEDYLATTRLSLPIGRSDLVVGPYEFDVEFDRTPEGRVLRVQVNSDLVLPSFVTGVRPSREIRRFMIQERQRATQL